MIKAVYFLSNAMHIKAQIIYNRGVGYSPTIRAYAPMRKEVFTASRSAERPLLAMYGTTSDALVRFLGNALVPSSLGWPCPTIQ